MPHYSFKVWAEDDVILPKYFLTIGQGCDVFNQVVPDLDKFVEELREEGVRVLAHYRLDDFEEIPPVTVDLCLPTGEPGSDHLLLSTAVQTSHNR